MLVLPDCRYRKRGKNRSPSVQVCVSEGVVPELLCHPLELWSFPEITRLFFRVLGSSLPPFLPSERQFYTHTHTEREGERERDTERVTD